MAILKETPNNTFTLSTDYIDTHIKVVNGLCWLVDNNGFEQFIDHVPSSIDIDMFRAL